MTKDYPLDNEQPARLHLVHEGATVFIDFDGAREAVLRGWGELKKGWTRQLENGSTLEVRTIRRAIFPELSILRNGRHVDSSPSHPRTMLRSSTNTLLVLAALTLVLAPLGQSRGAMWASVAEALAFGLGAMLLRAGRRFAAVVIAVPMFVRLDLILLAAFAGTLEGRSWIFSVLANLVLINFAVRAYQAANDMRKLNTAPGA